MLAQQKTLLADVRALEADARKLYGAGVKIPGVVQKLRGAADELQTRVNYLDRAEKPAARKKVAALKTPKPPEAGNDAPTAEPGAQS